MIVVEGPDGAGKTTLITQLSELLDLPVAPRVVTKETRAMVDLQQWVDNNLDAGFQRTIFDRHRLISEPIYGPIIRQEQQPGFTDLGWLGPRIGRFYALKPVIIYCIPPWETVWANIKGDMSNLVVRDRMQSIYSAYVNRAAIDHHVHRDNVFIWNYTDSPQVHGRPGWVWEVNEIVKERTQ